jgi:hypothetical protein
VTVYQPADFTFWFEDWITSEGDALTDDRFWAVGHALMALLDDPRQPPAKLIQGTDNWWLIDLPGVPGRTVAAWYIVCDDPPVVTLLALDTLD